MPFISILERQSKSGTKTLPKVLTVIPYNLASGSSGMASVLFWFQLDFAPKIDAFPHAIYYICHLRSPRVQRFVLICTFKLNKPYKNIWYRSSNISSNRKLLMRSAVWISNSVEFAEESVVLLSCLFWIRTCSTYFCGKIRVPCLVKSSTYKSAVK